MLTYAGSLVSVTSKYIPTLMALALAKVKLAELRVAPPVIATVAVFGYPCHVPPPMNPPVLCMSKMVCCAPEPRSVTLLGTFNPLFMRNLPGPTNK
jgi:hypothetical protein